MTKKGARDDKEKSPAGWAGDLGYLLFTDLHVQGEDGEGELLVAFEVVELHLEGLILVVVTTRIVGVLDGVALGEGVEDLVIDDLVVFLVLNLDCHRGDVAVFNLIGVVASSIELEGIGLEDGLQLAHLGLQVFLRPVDIVDGLAVLVELDISGVTLIGDGIFLRVHHGSTQ